MTIHKSAIVDPKADLDSSVEVGPGAFIDANVKIGAGSCVMANAYITGHTTMGENNLVHVGAVIGSEPQHMAYDGKPRYIEIGDNNTFREYVTVHASYVEGEATRIGNGCFLMATSHVGHDSHLGNEVIMANAALLAGHTTVGDKVFLSGSAAVHQNVRIGRMAIVQGNSAIMQDVPPFMMAFGQNMVAGLNVIGLKRGGVEREARKEIREAFRVMYRKGHSISQAIKILKEKEFGAEVQELIEFMETTKRGVIWKTQGELKD